MWSASSKGWVGAGCGAGVGQGTGRAAGVEGGWAESECGEGPPADSGGGGGGGSSATHAGSYLLCHRSETGVMPFRVSVWICNISRVRCGHFCTRVYKTADPDAIVFSGHLVSLKNSV